MGVTAVRLVNMLLCEPPRPGYSLRRPIANTFYRDAAVQQALLRPLLYSRGLTHRLCEREVSDRCWL